MAGPAVPGRGSGCYVLMLIPRLCVPYLPQVYAECMLSGMSVPLTLLGLLGSRLGACI